MTTRNITFKAKWIKILSTVPAGIRAQYVAAIYEYILNGTEPKDLHMQVAFAFFKDEIDRAARRRDARRNCDRNPDNPVAVNNPDNPVAANTETQPRKSPYDLTDQQKRDMVEDKKQRCKLCPYMMHPDRCENKECNRMLPTDRYTVNCLFTEDD